MRPHRHANNVPNFPQDAYMEGPMMNMDKLVDKPENLGLASQTGAGSCKA